jgi:hypothetical protein
MRRTRLYPLNPGVTLALLRQTKCFVLKGYASHWNRNFYKEKLMMLNPSRP